MVVMIISDKYIMLICKSGACLCMYMTVIYIVTVRCVLLDKISDYCMSRIYCQFHLSFGLSCHSFVP